MATNESRPRLPVGAASHSESARIRPPFHVKQAWSPVGRRMAGSDRLGVGAPGWERSATRYWTAVRLPMLCCRVMLHRQAALHCRPRYGAGRQMLPDAVLRCRLAPHPEANRVARSCSLPSGGGCRAAAAAGPRGLPGCAGSPRPRRLPGRVGCPAAFVAGPRGLPGRAGFAQAARGYQAARGCPGRVGCRGGVGCRAAFVAGPRWLPV